MIPLYKKIIILTIFLSFFSPFSALAQQSAVQDQTYHKNFIQDYIYIIRNKMREFTEKLSQMREEAKKARERMAEFSERIKEQSRQTKEKLDDLRRKMQENSEKNKEMQQRNQDLLQRNKDHAANQRAKTEALQQTQADRARN